MILKSPLVLVVEDEGLIRLNLVDELEDAGFRVIEASNADEALKALDSRPDIQAIFTDIDMPGSIDGLRFATTVRQSQPRMPILLTSGYLKIAKNELPLEMPFLSKPYEVGQVVNHLRELIPG